MPWLTIIIVMAIILVVGSAMALYWWNIAAQISPYKDELEKQAARKRASQDENVQIIDMPPVEKSPRDPHAP